MSLSFPRSPQSVFSQQRARAHGPTPEHSQSSHDFLHFHPLQPSQRPPRGAQPVNPLPHGRQNPLTPQRQNPLQHVAHPRQQPPAHPMGHMPPPNQQGHQAAQQPPHAPQMPSPMQATPPPPNRQPMSPTPHNAAEQFRRVNQGLPDGVMYEPLDDETMRILKAMQPPPLPTPPTSPQEEPEKPTLSLDVAKTIESLAQDEHNAHIFYTNLTQHATADKIKDALMDLAGECVLRHKKYTKMLKSHFDIDFEVAEKDINTGLPFAEGILLALSEETHGLSTLANLLEQTEGSPLEGQIAPIINKKILTNQRLLYCAIANMARAC